jgi:hypothetical protein
VSGIEELRHLLMTLFAERRDVLKAWAALGSLEALVQERDDGAGRVAVEIERILSSAHELRELQLLGALRSGLVPLRPEEQEELELLIGQPGLGVAARVRAEPGAEREAVLAAIERWRARAENPLSSRPVVETANAVSRTLEGLLVGLDGS